MRAAIRRSEASIAELSRQLGGNPKRVAKWRKRATVEDLTTGPKTPPSTVLSEAEEAMIVAFRRYSLLPLADCPYAFQPTIPHLTRSTLHRPPPAPRHLATARRGGGQTQAAALQALTHRHFPHRHRRGPRCRRQALPVRGHRPDQQVRLCTASQEGGE